MYKILFNDLILRWCMLYLGLSTITVWFKLTEVASTFTARLRSRYSMSEYNREEELESCLVDWIIGSWLWSTQITIITNRNQIMVCQGGDLGAGSCSKIVCGDDRWRCSDSTWRVTWIDHFWTITTIKQIINCILLSPNSISTISIEGGKFGKLRKSLKQIFWMGELGLTMLCSRKWRFMSSHLFNVGK